MGRAAGKLCISCGEEIEGDVYEGKHLLPHTYIGTTAAMHGDCAHRLYMHAPLVGYKRDKEVMERLNG